MPTENEKAVALRDQQAALAPLRRVADPASQRRLDELEVRARELDYFARIGDAMARGGLLPKGMNAQGAAIVLIKGRELGLDEGSALATLTVINGRVGVMNEAALALIRRADVLKPGTDIEHEWVGEPGTDSYGCRVRLHRKRHKDPFESTFTVGDAKKARKWGSPGPWSEYPTRMLFNRALGFLVKDYFSDVTLGLTLEAELRDIGTGRTERVEATLEQPIEEDPFLVELAKQTRDETAQDAVYEADDGEPVPPVAEPEVVDADVAPAPGDWAFAVKADPVAEELPAPKIESVRSTCPNCGAVDDYPVGVMLDCSSECGWACNVDLDSRSPVWSKIAVAPPRPAPADDPLESAIRASVVAAAQPVEEESDPFDIPAAPNPRRAPMTVATCDACSRPAEYPYSQSSECPYPDCSAQVRIDDEGEKVPAAPAPAPKEAMPLPMGDRKKIRMLCKCGQAAFYDAEWGGGCPRDGCSREMRPAADGFRCYSGPVDKRPPLPKAIAAK